MSVKRLRAHDRRCCSLAVHVHGAQCMDVAAVPLSYTAYRMLPDCAAAALRGNGCI